MRGILYFLIIMLGVMAHPARAATISADYLLRVCEADVNGDEIIEYGHVTCQAYIAGIIDYQKMLKSMNIEPPAVEFCVPDNADMKDVQMRVYRYLKTNTEQQGPFIASPGVAIALKTFYPCKKK